MSIQIINNPLKCQCQLQKKNNDNYRFGLYILPEYLPENMRETPLMLPLEHIDFKVKITNNISTTTITQTYKNYYSQYISSQYLFPVSTEACFQSFSAEFDGKIIQGVIKEKEQAREEFNEHKERGNLVAISEVSEDMKDIMKIEIANIQGNSEIKITFVYTEELQISQNTFWMYKLLSILSPRYCNSSSSDLEYQNINQMIENQLHKQFQTTIQVCINSDSKIEFMRSPSHSFNTYKENMIQNEILATVNLSQFDNDFVILYRDEGINKPSVIVGKNDIQCCAQLNYVPNFANLQVEDAFKCQIRDEGRFEVNMNIAKGEYIFVLDRSGSMDGQRIQSAKDALQFFLKSLPPKSYFNIYSFGSHYEAMFDSSINYNQSSLDIALQKIKSFSADMGGTEIFEPLQQIFSQQAMKNMPRQIFLLTDGGVSSPNQIFELIKRQTKISRVHSIGVGSGCSTHLIKESARIGKGKYIFLQDNEDLTGQIIDLLEQSLTPCLSVSKFIYDDSLIEFIVPNPENMPLILKNEPFSIYVFFKPGVDLEQVSTQIQLECLDSCQDAPMNYILSANNSCKLDNAVFKLGIFKAIKSLQDHLDNPVNQQDVQNKINQYNPKETVKQIREYKLQNRCNKGHDLQLITLAEERIKNIVCDECNENCFLINSGSFRCEKCDFDRCEKCQQICVPQLCSKGHQLQYFSINTQKINFIQCDICNYAPKDLGIGTYRCEQCDFDTCDNCYQQECQEIQNQQLNVKQRYFFDDDDIRKFDKEQLKIQFNDIYFAKIIHTKEYIQKLSVQNQVLSTQTAYLCVIQELDEENHSLNQITSIRLKQEYQKKKDIVKFQVSQNKMVNKQNFANMIQFKSNVSKIIQKQKQHIPFIINNRNFYDLCYNDNYDKHGLYYNDNYDLQYNDNYDKYDTNNNENWHKYFLKHQAKKMSNLQNQKFGLIPIPTIGSPIKIPIFNKIEEDLETIPIIRHLIPIPILNIKDENLEKILNMQQYSGKWSYSQDTIQILGLSKLIFEESIPSCIKGKENDLSVWTTILVYDWIEKYFQHKKQMWQLLLRKAKSWVNSNTQSQFNNLLQEAEKNICQQQILLLKQFFVIFIYLILIYI